MSKRVSIERSRPRPSLVDRSAQAPAETAGSSADAGTSAEPTDPTVSRLAVRRGGAQAAGAAPETDRPSLVVPRTTGRLRVDEPVGRWVLAATVLGSSMAFIDGTVVNVALSALSRELHSTVVDNQWVVEAYGLALAALLLVGGALGDLFGRRRVYAIGVGLFALASLFCGLASTPFELVLARAAQGVGAALLVPGSLAIISASFEPGQRGQAIGTWSAFSAITAGVGPTIGGWVVEHWSWRWIFILNVPLGAAVIAILLWKAPESRAEGPRLPLDWPGAVLISVALGGVVYGLIEQAHLGVAHPLVLGSLAVGVAAAVAFFAWEARCSAPMLPLGLFRDRVFAGANAATFLLYAPLGTVLFFYPMNLQQVQGYGAFEAGAALLPLVVVVFVLSRWAGRLVDRTGPRLPLVVGSLITALAYLALALPGRGGTYFTSYFAGVVLLGTGMALSVPPLTTAVMTSVPAHRSGLASGVNNALSRASTMLAIAVLGVLAIGVFNVALDGRLVPLGLPADALAALAGERTKLAEAAVPAGLAAPTAAAVSDALALAFLDAFRALMVACSALSLCAAAVGAVFMRSGPVQGGHDTHVACLE